MDVGSFSFIIKMKNQEKLNNRRPDMKYKVWLESWLENYIDPTSKKRTREQYREIIKKHIAPALGEYEISELSPMTVQSHISELLKSGNMKTSEGLSPNTVNVVISVIQSSLKTAYNLNIIPEDFGKKLKRPKMTEKRVECFTLAEQKRIELSVEYDERPKMFGVILCLYTGMRIGELLALEWRDVDLREKKINIERTCHYGREKDGRTVRITDTPKTDSSKRTIPIPRQLIPRLKEQKRRSRSVYVIEDGKGDPVSVRSYQRSFELLLKRVNVKRKGFHALRHTFATRALECGMDVKTLSEILGHKNPNVTLNRYAHSMFEHKRSMMNKLGRLLSDA